MAVTGTLAETKDEFVIECLTYNLHEFNYAPTELEGVLENATEEQTLVGVLIL
jgi:hypothetical protein